MNCRGMKPRVHNIILPDHAWGRYLERSEFVLLPGQEKRQRKKLIEYLMAKLNDEIRVGLMLDHTGAAWVELTTTLWATVRLGETGWVVTTVTDWGQKEAG